MHQNWTNSHENGNQKDNTKLALFVREWHTYMPTASVEIQDIIEYHVKRSFLNNIKIKTACGQMVGDPVY